jgi:hypothetical protein
MSFKTALRNAAPSLYTFALRLRRSDFIGHLESIPRFRALHAAQATNGRYFAVNLKGKIGFAGTLSQVIAILLYCNEKNLHPVIRITNPLYTNRTDGNHNWFCDFFDYVDEVPAEVVERLTFSDIEGQSDYTRDRLDDDISIEQAHELYASYFKIKPAAIADAIAFAEREFTTPVVGIHYRGTDKRYESPLIQYDRMDQFFQHALEKIFSGGADEKLKIFVATDDMNYLDHLRSGPFRNQILYFECEEMGADGNPIHFSAGDNYQKGVEALSTMYLLSKCAWCVKTTSQLSAWSKILNPKLKIYIPERSIKQFFHFPDKQMWESREQI